MIKFYKLWVTNKLKKMKKIITITLLLTLTLSTFAQKFGHINSQELLSLMPEKSKAESELQEYATSLEDQLLSMQSELQSSYEEYTNNVDSYDALTKQDKEAAIQAIDQRIRNFQQSAQVSLQEKEQKLLEPILKKAQNAIDEVAKDGKYTYILDSGSGVLLYSKDSEDILSKVKKELGI